MRHEELLEDATKKVKKARFDPAKLLNVSSCVLLRDEMSSEE